MPETETRNLHKLFQALACHDRPGDGFFENENAGPRDAFLAIEKALSPPLKEQALDAAELDRQAFAAECLMIRLDLVLPFQKILEVLYQRSFKDPMLPLRSLKLIHQGFQDMWEVRQLALPFEAPIVAGLLTKAYVQVLPSWFAEKGTGPETLQAIAAGAADVEKLLTGLTLSNIKSTMRAFWP